MKDQIQGATFDNGSANNLVQVEEQIKIAVLQEKAAEQKAIQAEEQMRMASNAQQRKSAKKKLVKAQKKLKLAEL